MHFHIHNNARDDLLKIAAVDKKAAATVYAVLEQASADPNVINKLTQLGRNSFGENVADVKEWVATKRWGLKDSLWRFRLLNTPATSYRIVYGYHWPTRDLCVLAALHKDELNYDDFNDPIVKRILTDWASITE